MKRTSTWCVVLGVCLACGPFAQGAFYDDFQDGHYWQDPNDEPFDDGIGGPPLYNNPPFDPNKWDMDNPHWLIRQVIGSNGAADASDGWLRLYTQLSFLDVCFIAASFDDGDSDPNTSASWYDDSAPHYMVGKVKVWDPNRAEVSILIMGDYTYWTAYGITHELDARDKHTNLYHVNGFEFIGASGEGDSRWDLDPNGFWMVCQFDGDGDPNNSYLRGACWNGEKFDWDGVWDYEAHILSKWDPNGFPYYDGGVAGMGTLVSPDNGGGLDCDAKFDQIEVRGGVFSNVGRSLTFEIYKPENGTATIDPDLLVDPNNLSTDPNVLTDPNEPRIYTDGTEVVFVAHPDPNGPGFNMWEVFDPADANNDFTDSNLVLTLTMDRDWKVTARYKCGSGGLLPMAGMTLLALGVGVVMRKFM